jgi:hypothetical protein
LGATKPESKHNGQNQLPLHMTEIDNLSFHNNYII